MQVTALNMNYTDNGLFGMYTVSEGNATAKVCHHKHTMELDIDSLLTVYSLSLALDSCYEGVQ